jgi:hypothetical protein
MKLGVEMKTIHASYQLHEWIYMYLNIEIGVGMGYPINKFLKLNILDQTYIYIYIYSGSLSNKDFLNHISLNAKIDRKIIQIPLNEVLILILY